MIIVTIITSCGATGVVSYTRGKSAGVTLENNPLTVKDADAHYVTAKQHADDIKRIVDKMDENKKDAADSIKRVEDKMEENKKDAAKQHTEDIQRVYDKMDENSAKINQIVGLVQGIRDTLQNLKQK